LIEGTIYCPWSSSSPVLAFKHIVIWLLAKKPVDYSHWPFLPWQESPCHKF